MQLPAHSTTFPTIHLARGQHLYHMRFISRLQRTITWKPVFTIPQDTMSSNPHTRRRKTTPGSPEPPCDCQDVRGHDPESLCDRAHEPHLHPDTPEGHSSILPCASQPFVLYTPKCPSAQRVGQSAHTPDEGPEDGTCKKTLSAENEVEALKLANNYKFGFRKWKSHVTARPFEDRSDVVKELYSELNVIKPQTGSLFTFGNVMYFFLFGWWVSLVYFSVGLLMFFTLIGFPYGKLCWKLSCYFLWPFGKTIEKATASVNRYRVKIFRGEATPEETEEIKVTSPLLLPTPVEEITEETQVVLKDECCWRRGSMCAWLFLGYPLMAVTHILLSVLSWLLVFTIPVSKMSTRTLGTILLLPPDQVLISSAKENQSGQSKVLLCCYHAVNCYYYKYTVDGINVFAVIIVALVIGYVDKGNQFVSSEVKFATAIGSIIPLSYYIGMGIASISAQSNFALGAVVNATFGSIAEMTFYITALIRGHRQGNKCLQEIVKAALTGTLLGCILFIPGICMIIGGLKHSEQRFNSRSAGVSSALLFISVGGVFAPTLFSKAYGNLVCEGCTNSSNSTSNTSESFICRNCHYDLSENNYSLFHSHIEPLVYTVSALLPVAYLIGLIFTLKTHSHIYDIHVEEGQEAGHLGAVVHWSRWRAMLILIMATVLMSLCADLTTEHIQPILNHPAISQYFIGVTVVAMIPEIPEIVNGIQFALQNNISLSLEVGSCIAVQVCMIQIPLLILFNVFYEVGFVLVFSDLHLWTSIFSVILVNYIFMDGKSDYFQGTALVVVYLILLALYFFAPSPAGC